MDYILGIMLHLNCLDQTKMFDHRIRNYTTDSHYHQLRRGHVYKTFKLFLNPSLVIFYNVYLTDGLLIKIKVFLYYVNFVKLNRKTSLLFRETRQVLESLENYFILQGLSFRFNLIFTRAFLQFFNLIFFYTHHSFIVLLFLSGKTRKAYVNKFFHPNKKKGVSILSTEMY